MKTPISIILFAALACSFGQVIDKIKTKSSENQTNRSSSSGSGSSNQTNQSQPRTNNYQYTPRPNNQTQNYNQQNQQYYNNNNYYVNQPYENSNYNYNTNNTNNNNYSTSRYNRPTRTNASNVNSSGIIDEQNRILDLKDSMPEVSCIEANMDVSLSPNTQTYLLNPRLRLVKGMFGTEFRYFALYEKPDSEYGWIKYTNFDWQILQLNIFSKKAFKLRTGIGLTREFYSKTTFFDWGYSGEIYPIAPLKLKFDFRNNFDLVTGVNPRKLFMFGGEFRLNKNQKSKTLPFFGFNVTYMNFYNSIELWTIGPSICIRFQ